MRILGRHRPVNERARRVAISQGRLAVLSVLEDHRIRAAANSGRFPHARRFNGFDAHRSGREQSAEQHPLIAERQPKRLIPVPRLQRLTSVQGDVVRQLDLAVAADDAFAPGQLDHDTGHASMPAKAGQRSHS